jgi:hypothetical protein
MVTKAPIDGVMYTSTNWPVSGQWDASASSIYHARGWNTTYCTYIGNLGSGVASAGFVGEGISLQEAAVVGGNIWASGSFTDTEVFYDFNTVAAIYTGAPSEPFSGYDVLQQFGMYASKLIAKQGIRLISTHIREWFSEEEPQWKQLVIDFEVEAQSDAALELWDDLSGELRSFLTAWRDKTSSDLRDLISITVQWK